MTDNNENTSGNVGLYKSPQVEVIFVKTQGVLCQSNDWTTYSSPEEDQLP